MRGPRDYRGPGAPRADVQHAPAAGRSRGVWVGAVLGAILGAAMATQYTASRLAYHPHLGPWLYRVPTTARTQLRTVAVVCAVAAAVTLLRRGWRWWSIPFALAAITAIAAREGPLYAPVRVFTWHAAYQSVPAYQALFIQAWIILGAVALIVTIGLQRVIRREVAVECDCPCQAALAARGVRRSAPAQWGARCRPRPLSAVRDPDIAPSRTGSDQRAALHPSSGSRDLYY